MDFDYSVLSPAFARLSKPAKRALIGQGILSPADLAGWRRSDVASLHGVGPSAFPTLDSALRDEGLEFRVSPSA